jgi:predicted Zn-dependent protease
MSTRRPWKFRTAPTTAILDQPDAMRQESWHTSAFRLESRLSPSSSVQNISTRIGETVADTRLTLYPDPEDRTLLGQPFDNEGLPIKRTMWIEKGVLRNLAYTRFWA